MGASTSTKWLSASICVLVFALLALVWPERPRPGQEQASALSANAMGDNQPKEFWWYWDRPAQQLPAPPPGVGAAIVTSHVYFSADRMRVIGRRSELRLAADVVIIPVIHVEVDPARPFAASAAQREALRAAVLDLVAIRRPPWVQLDFEARPTQREFWLASVRAIRASLPTDIGLSVTALASWCYGDEWLGDVPVDEIVPMYFRLGRAREEFEARSAAGEQQARCLQAHGVADDEAAWPAELPGRRYVFLGAAPHPHSSR